MEAGLRVKGVDDGDVMEQNLQIKVSRNGMQDDFGFTDLHY